MIVGIDLGSRSCGWAVLSGDGTRCDSGTWNLALRPATKTRAADHRALRWIAMLQLSRDLLTLWRPAALVYERPVGRADGGGRATFLLHGGLLAQLEIAAYGLDYELPIVELSPGEWKRAMVGSGAAKKPAYIAAANELHELQLDGRGEDEAAALLIAGAAIKLGKVGST